MTLAEIREKAKTLRSELRAINEVATPTEEQLNRGEAVMRELQKLDRQRELAEEEQRQRKLDEIPAPRAGAADYDPQIDGVPETREAGCALPVSLRSSADFPAWSRANVSMGKFKDVREYITTLATKPWDERLKGHGFELRDWESGQPSLGGHLLADTIANPILDLAFQDGDFLDLVRTIPVSPGAHSLSVKVISWNNLDRSGNTTAGGLKAYHVGEGATITQSTGALRFTKLELKAIAVLTFLSEQIQQATNLASDITTQMQNEIRRELHDNIIRGTGVGEPLGILNSPALVTQDAETGQAAATVNYSNLRRMFGRMLPGSRSNAVWLVNHDLIPELLQQSIPVGTGGSHVPLLNESNGKFSIFGRPCIATDFCSALGTTGDILFVDFNAYGFAMMNGIRVLASEHFAMDTLQLTLRAHIFCDGMPLLDAPITPARGTNTVSPFVALETRS